MSQTRVRSIPSHLAHLKREFAIELLGLKGVTTILIDSLVVRADQEARIAVQIADLERHTCRSLLHFQEIE